MPITKHANNELVTVGWLKAMLGITEVATSLPDTWSTEGFVTVSDIGGASDIYVPLREPIMTVDCWAVSASSGKAPWNTASNYAESIRAATFDFDNIGKLLTIGTGFPNARVKSVYLTQEPRRVPDDAGSFAHYSMDMYVSWIEVPS